MKKSDFISYNIICKLPLFSFIAAGFQAWAGTSTVLSIVIGLIVYVICVDRGATVDYYQAKNKRLTEKLFLK